MPTVKIADIPANERCQHPEHRPPSMMVWPDGVYEHTCPGCGQVSRFVVRKPTM